MNNKVRVWSLSSLLEDDEDIQVTTIKIDIADEDVPAFIEMIKEYYNKRKK